MRQFCQAPDSQLTALKSRARGRCVRFDRQELPPGATPRTARVGIEINSSDESTKLFVEKGISYEGHIPMIQRWFKEGCLQFGSFEELCRWIRHELAAAYSSIPPAADLNIPGLQRAEQDGKMALSFLGNDEVLAEAELVLACRVQPAAVMLVGPSGVGKTARCRELSRRWCAGGNDRVALRLDLAALFAGAIFPGERQQRLQLVLSKVVPLAPSALLVTEELHLACAAANAVATTDYQSTRSRRNLADPLASLAVRDAIDAGLRVAGTTTPRGWQMLGQTALRWRLHAIPLGEPSLKTLVDGILPEVARQLESRYGIAIAREALAFVARQSADQLGRQPAKAIRLLESAVIKAQLRELTVLGPDDVLP